MKKKIKVVIITEDEPFHLADAFDYFFSCKPDGYDFPLALVLNYFHTNRKTKNRIKTHHILRVFGPFVFLRILWRLFLGRVQKSKKVEAVFQEQGIQVKKGIKNINSNEVVNEIKKYQPDIIIAIGVNSLFQKPLRDLAPLGCINVHTGVRPEHRGRASMFWALADGHDETGITVHYIDEGIDSGHVITIHYYKIAERSFDRLLRDLRLLSMDALIDALTIIRNGHATEQQNKKQYHAKFKPLPGIDDLKIFVERGNKVF